MSVNVLKFDKENKQIEYQFMARSIETDKLVVGYIVIEKPWYSNESEWTYYIVNNKYGSGFCGGASDLGFEKTIVNPTTIKQFNQTSQIEYNQECGMDTMLIDERDYFNPENEKQIALINYKDNIPYELWGK